MRTNMRTIVRTRALAFPQSDQAKDRMSELQTRKKRRYPKYGESYSRIIGTRYERRLLVASTFPDEARDLRPCLFFFEIKTSLRTMQFVFTSIRNWTVNANHGYVKLRVSTRMPAPEMIHLLPVMESS